MFEFPSLLSTVDTRVGPHCGPIRVVTVETVADEEDESMAIRHVDLECLSR
jgi:hypothetical protein